MLIMRSYYAFFGRVFRAEATWSLCVPIMRSLVVFLGRKPRGHYALSVLTHLGIRSTLCGTAVARKRCRSFCQAAVYS